MRFHKKLLFFLVTAFIVFTAIGTMAHELGHYFVAKVLGYRATIGYSFTYFYADIPVADSAFITA